MSGRTSWPALILVALLAACGGSHQHRQTHRGAAPARKAPPRRTAAAGTAVTASTRGRAAPPTQALVTA